MDKTKDFAFFKGVKFYKIFRDEKGYRDKELILDTTENLLTYDFIETEKEIRFKVLEYWFGSPYMVVNQKYFLEIHSYIPRKDGSEDKFVTKHDDLVLVNINQKTKRDRAKNGIDIIETEREYVFRKNQDEYYMC